MVTHWPKLKAGPSTIAIEVEAAVQGRAMGTAGCEQLVYLTRQANT